jgi:2',3'-cyclic-nucleotide 2'-phosphodiesterase (5'-nucleotidase family)
LFFPDGSRPPGMNFTDVSHTLSTFGYYKYQIPNTDLTFIGLNTVYFIEENLSNREVSGEQILWLNETLSEIQANGTKAVISGHVFPGLYVDSMGDSTSFWH